jgi:hypothetical protein
MSHRSPIDREDLHYDTVESIAEEEGVSLGRVVCEAAAEYLTASEATRRRELLQSIAGIGEDAEVTGEDHDRFLYGLAGER